MKPPIEQLVARVIELIGDRGARREDARFQAILEFLDEHAHLFESRPVEERELTVERCRHCGLEWACPDCDGTPQSVIPEGAEEFTSDGMRALRFTNAEGQPAEVRVTGPDSWERRLPGRSWDCLLEEDVGDETLLSAPAFPWLRSVWAEMRENADAERLQLERKRLIEANTEAYLSERADVRVVPGPTCKCTCGSKKFADGLRVVSLPRPPHMYPTEHGDVIEVDRCIAPVVEYLWGLGIWTTGACCGHDGRMSGPSVCVTPDWETTMIGLGYEPMAGCPGCFLVHACEPTKSPEFSSSSVVEGEERGETDVLEILKSITEHKEWNATTQEWEPTDAAYMAERAYDTLDAERARHAKRVEELTDERDEAWGSISSAISFIERLGHTNHCAHRLAFGDGECECFLIPRYRCRTCGCLWRTNPDNSLSLFNSQQSSCAGCEEDTIGSCEHSSIGFSLAREVTRWKVAAEEAQAKAEVYQQENAKLETKLKVCADDRAESIAKSLRDNPPDEDERNAILDVLGAVDFKKTDELVSVQIRSRDDAIKLRSRQLEECRARIAELESKLEEAVKREEELKKQRGDLLNASSVTHRHDGLLRRVTGELVDGLESRISILLSQVDHVGADNVRIIERDAAISERDTLRRERDEARAELREVAKHPERYGFALQSQLAEVTRRFVEFHSAVGQWVYDNNTWDGWVRNFADLKSTVESFPLPTQPIHITEPAGTMEVRDS